MNDLISTDKLYQNPNNDEFVGIFAKYRKMLDYTYYTNYNLQRQDKQDQIISKYLGNGPEKYVNQPQLIFTCGCFGAGKSHCVKYLHSINKLNLDRYIYIDPDRIKYQLPEASNYIIKDPLNSGSLLHTESMYISLLMQYICFDRSYQMIIDGSMRECDWFVGYIKWINITYPIYKIGIIQVKANLDLILDRCQRRGKSTGRIISPELINKIYPMIQPSFDKLKTKVDFHMIIENNQAIDIKEENDHPVVRLEQN